MLSTKSPPLTRALLFSKVVLSLCDLEQFSKQDIATEMKAAL